MPRSFFDQVLVQAPRRRSPWVTAGSITLHMLGLALLFVLPLTAAVTLPGVHTPLPPVMLASVELPPAPVEVAPAPASSAPQLNPDAAPLVAPDTVPPEVERVPASTIPLPPGGLPGTGSPRAYTSLGPATGITGLGTPPPPQPPAPRRLGGDIQAPTRTFYKAPVYPPVAQSARIEGLVILEATIDAQGTVQNVTVLRSVPLLDRAAVEAVQQWRYTPTRLNGQAIPIIMTVTVSFTIR